MTRAAAVALLNERYPPTRTRGGYGRDKSAHISLAAYMDLIDILVKVTPEEGRRLLGL